ncbi:MAG: peptidylprolyl isomerase [Pirellulaceae bacterium]|nr:peptidylprolyl isomerase [Pirellulaceae bacterium]
MSCLLVGLIGKTAIAQPAHSSDEPTFIEVKAKTAAFQASIDNFRKHIKRLFDSELRFHASDLPSEQQLLREQWSFLREEGFVHHQSLLQAALDEFQQAPAESVDIGSMLYEALKRGAGRDDYEGLLPIARGLYHARYPADDLLRLLVLCSLADNQYQLAREPLQQLIDSQQASPEVLKLFADVDVLEKQWTREQEILRQDSVGDPLPQAHLETTKGKVVIELFENQAPQAVANFVSLAEQGFYNFSDFFLVVDNGVAQAGCPKSDGTGGPGYFIPAERDAAVARGLFRGYVGLARLPDLPDSGGSQFFISFLPNASLNVQATVFGRVISGMHNVARLNRVDPKAKSDKKTQERPPAEADEIISVTVLNKRLHDYRPTRLPQPGLPQPGRGAAQSPSEPVGTGEPGQ